jgi:hypothetical protein
MEVNTSRQDQDLGVEVCDLANTIGKLKLTPLSFLLFSAHIYHQELQQYF